MNKYYYKKSRLTKQKLARFLGLGIFSFGLFLVLYIFTPLILWQVYFAPAFAAQDITSPIPQLNIATPSNLKHLVFSRLNELDHTDYSNAKNWFPNYPTQNTHTGVLKYSLAIPKIHIMNAVVSTSDNDLSSHLVNFGGTAIPPQKGNAVIFGHSTLPQWFDPKNYKTIFAHAYELRVGDDIIATIDTVSYTYKIYQITVVDPEDTSLFAQLYDNSYITLVTCTPPGTTWKRLVIKAILQKI